MKRLGTIIVALASIVILPISAKETATVSVPEPETCCEMKMSDSLCSEHCKSADVAILVSQARRGERTAYETLARMNRYGEGGVEKNLFNAIGFYMLAGKDVDELFAMQYNEDPNDELGLMFHLIDRLDCKGEESTRNMLDSLTSCSYPWVEELKWVIDNGKKNNFKELVAERVRNSRTPDEAMIDAIGYTVLNSTSPNKEEEDFLMAKVAENVQFFNNVLGDDELYRYFVDEENNKECLHTAIACFRKAFDKGMLTPKNASKLMSKYMEERVDLKEIFNDRELEDLRQLASYAPEWNGPEVIGTMQTEGVVEMVEVEEVEVESEESAK